MRFVIEHPWASGCILGSISFALIWTGLRDGKLRRIKFGLLTVVLAVAAMIIGNLFSTPRENATRVVRGFIYAVIQNNISEVSNISDKKTEIIFDIPDVEITNNQGLVEFNTDDFSNAQNIYNFSFPSCIRYVSYQS